MVAVLLLAPTAQAGIADTPLPIIPPATKAAKHLFSVPGVISTANVATVITCTSLDSSTFKVGVQFFNGGGALQNDVPGGDGSLDIAPGQTISIATQPVAGVNTDQISSSSLGTGSARIVSYSAKLTCTARVVSAAGNPPALLNTLTIIKKKTQKGD